MKPTLEIDPAVSSVRPGLVWAWNLPDCAETVTAPAYIADFLARVAASGESFLAPARKAEVRSMLRHGKYKPAGRSKPSSEYLLAAALGGEFPLVNGPVDVNNAVSLEYGYPASIFDADKTGLSLMLRHGRAGEAYVFNRSGQTIDLEDLVCVCRPGPDRDWMPVGNPVKDAMETKVFPGAHNIVAVIYAPAPEDPASLESACAAFARLLRDECGAETAGWTIAE